MSKFHDFALARACFTQVTQTYNIMSICSDYLRHSIRDYITCYLQNIITPIKHFLLLNYYCSVNNFCHAFATPP